MADNSIEPEEADFHVRHWMLPYLPRSIPRRDAVIMFGSIIIVGVTSITIVWFGHEKIGLAVLALGNAHFVVHYYFRAMDRWRKKTKKGK